MNLVKCSKGHYYDSDRYAQCPHCANAMGGDSVTVSLQASSGAPDATAAFGMDLKPSEDTNKTVSKLPEEPVTQKSTNADAVAASVSTMGMQGFDQSSFGNVMRNAKEFGRSLPEDDGKTVSYYDQAVAAHELKKEPVVGWLICTKGKHFGESFELKSGRNFVGRSREMDVSLTEEPTVSRDRHAVIVYEPHTRMFIIQPGDSRELFYVNDEVVLDSVTLKAYDEISLGKVNMKLIPCCCKEFAWEDVMPEEEKR